MNHRARTTWMRAGGGRAMGFTLIEVLMAVLVLGIGMLGLASVLPAVLKQQRDSIDSVLGIIAADAAEQYLRAGPTLAGYQGGNPRPYALDERFWSILLEPDIDPATGQAWNPPLQNLTVTSVVPTNGSWYRVPVVADGPTGPNQSELGPQQNLTRTTVVGQQEILQQRVYLSLAERLYPGDSSGASDPLFVWDMAVKRVARATGNTTPGGAIPLANRPSGFNRAMVAVFVRRVDPRIKIPRTQTLMATMLDPTLVPPERKNPVSVDELGLPTFDGRTGNNATYSQLRVSAADFTPIVNPGNFEEIRDFLIIADAFDVVQMASQVGQKLVDNLGNIYTVTASPHPLFGFGVQVSPPVPSSVAASGGGGPGPGGGNVEQPPRITQVIFSPQIPAAVRVFEVKP
ncbi:MAG: prepilin-type N-terminal cleavage/methylation domain-containing protein [Phycisphaerales bacterium]